MTSTPIANSPTGSSTAPPPGRYTARHRLIQTAPCALSADHAEAEHAEDLLAPAARDLTAAIAALSAAGNRPAGATPAPNRRRRTCPPTSPPSAATVGGACPGTISPLDSRPGSRTTTPASPQTSPPPTFGHTRCRRCRSSTPARSGQAAAAMPSSPRRPVPGLPGRKEHHARDRTPPAPGRRHRPRWPRRAGRSRLGHPGPTVRAGRPATVPGPRLPRLAGRHGRRGRPVHPDRPGDGRHRRPGRAVGVRRGAGWKSRSNPAGRNRSTSTWQSSPSPANAKPRSMPRSPRRCTRRSTPSPNAPNLCWPNTAPAKTSPPGKPNRPKPLRRQPTRTGATI